jgi:hypothetical protein
MMTGLRDGGINGGVRPQKERVEDGGMEATSRCDGGHGRMMWALIQTKDRSQFF